MFPGRSSASMKIGSAKHDFQNFIFKPAKEKIVDCLAELQKMAKDAFGKAAQAIIEQFI